MKLTPQQKLDAFSHRFYSNGQWEPKAGDHYTTSRADLELYQVVSVDENIVRTRYTEGSDTIAEWPAAGFLTEGFGPKRVFVPEWILSQPPKEYLIGDVTSEKVFRAAGLTNLSDLQGVFDAVEKALTPTVPSPDENPWRPWKDMPIGDQRFIVREVCGEEGQTALAYWTGRIFAFAPVNDNPVEVPFKVTGQRTPPPTHREIDS